MNEAADEVSADRRVSGCRRPRGAIIRTIVRTTWAVGLAACAAFAAGPTAGPGARGRRGARPGSLLDRRAVPITNPKGLPKPKPPVKVPVEGRMVIDRSCRLVPGAGGGWTVLTFEPVAGRAAVADLRALPCRLLERMEDLAAASPAVRFRVSGETTVFEQKGYLLPRKVTVLEPASRAAKPGAGPSAAVQPVAPTTAPKGSRPTTKPASATTRPAGGGEPTSDDVLKGLLNEKVGRPLTTPLERPEPVAAPSVAPASGRPLTGGVGGMVVDRLVRIVPEATDGWWVARFESDNTLREPPIRLLPCGFLARARRLTPARRSLSGPVVRITGEVTEYRRRRYLLLRKVLRERRLNRF